MTDSDKQMILPPFTDVFGLCVKVKSSLKKRKFAPDWWTDTNPSCTKSSEKKNYGRWQVSEEYLFRVNGLYLRTEEEHALFLDALMKYGHDWKSIAREVTTRSRVQVRSHASKVFNVKITSAEKTSS